MPNYYEGEKAARKIGILLQTGISNLDARRKREICKKSYVPRFIIIMVLVGGCLIV